MMLPIYYDDSLLRMHRLNLRSYSTKLYIFPGLVIPLCSFLNSISIDQSNLMDTIVSHIEIWPTV